MMDNFLLCVNGVVPIFLLIILGVYLKKWRIVGEGFCEEATRLVFNIALPVMIFYDIAASSISTGFSWSVIWVSTISMAVLFFLIWIITCFATKDPKKQAAFSQGAYRANYAILGLPLTKALFGTAAVANATVILAVSMVMLNVLAVVYLEMFLNGDGGMKRTMAGIFKNPIIIAAVLGSVFYFLHIPLPTFVDTSLTHISRMCVPLSLITIGASMHYESMRETMGLATMGAAIKTILVPLLFMPIAMLLGFRGEDLGVLFIFWASPSAVAGYAMTRQSGGDHLLAGNIIMLSTAMSFFVIFFGTLLLKTIGVF